MIQKTRKLLGIGSFLSIILILLSVSVNAGDIGNITVYVKDQNGDNVVDNSHLLGNLTVELWYEGRRINSTVFTDVDKNVIFTVTHTGLYTVTATAVLDIIDNNGCVKGYSDQRDYCYLKCPNGTSTKSIDERGIYTCVNPTGLAADYSIKHKYVEGSQILTYVDKGESDIAQITLITDKRTLGRYGKKWAELINETGENFIDIRAVNGTIYKTPWYYAVADETFQEGMSQVIEKGTEDVLKGTYGRTVAASSTATFIYIGTTDPDNLFTERTGYEIAGQTVSGLISTKIALAMGISTGPAFVLGVVVGLPVSSGIDFSFGERRDSRRCEHALTDDLNIFIGNFSKECTPKHYPFDSTRGDCSAVNDCLRYSVGIVNKGENLTDVFIGKDSDAILCDCISFTSPTENEVKTNSIYDKSVMYSYYNSSYYEYCSYPSKFAEYGRLWNKFKILPGVYCDFDTYDILPMLDYIPLDAPSLSRFQKSNPYIANPSYPHYTYPSTTAEIKTEIVDNAMVSAVQINWSYGATSGISQMTRTGSGMHTSWTANLQIPEFQQGQEFLQFLIQATDSDGISSINDNDQRNYRIQVVQDAGSGKDAYLVCLKSCCWTCYNQ